MRTLVMTVATFFAVQGALTSAPQTDGLEFEVASIRLNPDPNVNYLTGQIQTREQLLFAPSIPVRGLIVYAYDYQFRARGLVMGGPDWLDTERYEVRAQAAAPFSPPPGRGLLPREAAAMLRALLAERMRLKVRVEMQERTVYAVVLDRPDGTLGPNLTPAKGNCQGSMSTPDPAIPLPPCPFVFRRLENGSLFQLQGVTMAEMVSTFGNFPDINEQVIDRTGLTGRYDMAVRFQETMVLSPFAAPVPESVETIARGTFPPVEIALREQLGLRLERTRAPVEVIVIEHVERPSPN